jgi:hypothetical protein
MFFFFFGEGLSLQCFLGGFCTGQAAQRAPPKTTGLPLALGCFITEALGAARRALHCSYRSPSRAGASARRGVTAPTRMHASAKLMRELQNLLPRAGHTEVYA